MIEQKLTNLIESIEVYGFSRKVTRFVITKTKKEGYNDSIFIQLEFLSDTGSIQIDKFYNKWYFRFYNKFIEEFTNSDEEYLSMRDNNTEINFYNTWLNKLTYDTRGIYILCNLDELKSFLRDKTINSILKKTTQ